MSTDGPITMRLLDGVRADVVAGASVAIHAGDACLWRGRTNADGAFTLPVDVVPTGPVHITVTADETAFVHLDTVTGGDVVVWGAVHGPAPRPLHDGPWTAPRLAAALAVVAAIALALRLGAWWELAATPLAGDEREYLLTARRTVLTGPGWLWDTTRPVGTLRPVASMLWYGLVATLWGPSAQALRLGNVVLGTLLVVPTFAVGRHLGGVAVGLVAAALVALHPDLVLYSTSLWTEPLYLLAMMSALALLLTVSPRWELSATGAGALMAVALLTRDVGLVLPALGLLWVLVERPVTTVQRWRGLVLAAAVWAALVGAWSWRLNAGEGPAGLVSGVTSMNLYLGNTTNDPPYQDLGPDPQTRDAEARRLAMAAIADDLPWWPLRKLAITSPRFFTGAGLDTERLTAASGAPLRLVTRHETLEGADLRRSVARALLGLQAALGAFGLTGLVLAALTGWRRTRHVAWLLVVVVILHAVPTVVTFSKPRFALPTVPMWIAGCAWLAVHGRAAWARTSWPVRILVAGVALAAAWAFLRWVPRELRTPGA